MFGRLMLIFTIIPLVELYLLIALGKWIGTMNTVAIVILTAMVGASFARSQGSQIIVRIRDTYSQGQMPGRELVEGVMVLLGGVMLITPGLITDVFGLTLLFPFTRPLYLKLAYFYLQKKFQAGKIHVYRTENFESNNEYRNEYGDDYMNNSIHVLPDVGHDASNNEPDDGADNGKIV